MWRALGLLAALCAGAVQAQTSATRDGDTVATFEGPTNRYGHGIMGNLPEWSRLCLARGGDRGCTTLAETSVFEDMAPRLADMDGDGTLDAVVVESSTTGGAQLVVYRLDGATLTRTSTPAIGRRNRWLAPVGMADFDGDGQKDVAFVEKPHLDKTLRIYSWDKGVLKLKASISGLSNHRIGDETITSGIRNCGQGPQIIVPNGDWTRVYASFFAGGDLKVEPLGPFRSMSHFETYLTC